MPFLRVPLHDAPGVGKRDSLMISKLFCAFGATAAPAVSKPAAIASRSHGHRRVSGVLKNDLWASLQRTSSGFHLERRSDRWQNTINEHRLIIEGPDLTRRPAKLLQDPCRRLNTQTKIGNSPGPW